jgi:hypothetical protein
MKTLHLVLAVLSSTLSLTSFADDSKKEINKSPYTFKPSLMDSANNTGTVLGIEYRISKKWDFLESEIKPDPNGNFTPVHNGKGFGQDHAFVNCELNGNWTSDKDKNPKNLATFDSTLGYQWFRTQYSIDIATKVGIEGDQSYNNNQKTYSGQVSGYYSFTKDASTYIELLLGFGEVDAENDDTRKSITNKTKFNRANGEIYLNIRLPTPTTKTMYAPDRIGFNYRLFKEISAPSEIEEANLDEYQYGGVHVSFEKGFYLAYTV